MLISISSIRTIDRRVRTCLQKRNVKESARARHLRRGSAEPFDFGSDAGKISLRTSADARVRLLLSRDAGGYRSDSSLSREIFRSSVAWYQSADKIFSDFRRVNYHLCRRRNLLLLV